MKKMMIIILGLFLLISLCAKTAAKSTGCLTITGFADGSVLQKAGAAEGDVIQKYDNHKITNLAELSTARDKAIKDKIKIVLLRGKKKIVLSVPKGKLGVMLKEFIPDHPVLADAQILEGYGRLDWSNNTSNTFLACVASMEAKFGSKTEYRDLVGLSGYGFRVQVAQDFCPSAPDACSGKNIGVSILESLGYSTETMHILNKDSGTDQADPNKIPALRAMIKKSIEAGYPVIAIDMIEVADWGLITGFQKNNSQYWCRTFFDKTYDYEIAQKEPWEIYAVQGYKATDLKPAYYRSLKTALEMYQTKEYNGYRSGLEAYRFWIEQLSNEKAFDVLTEEELSKACHGNWWTFMSLAEARGYCADYLSANKERFGIETSKIKSLSSLYQDEADFLMMTLKDIPSTFDNPSRKWTQKDRDIQIQILKILTDIEKKAYNILLSI